MSTTAETAASALPWGMLGQDAEVQALARGVAAGAPAHAYLFTGPPGSGKGTLALKLAQALVCETPVDLIDGTTTARRAVRDNLSLASALDGLRPVPPPTGEGATAPGASMDSRAFGTAKEQGDDRL